MFPLKINSIKKYALLLAAALCANGMFLMSNFIVTAVSTDEFLETRRAMPVQSNEVPEWPQGPIVSAESAFLMDAETGAVLYSKISTNASTLPHHQTHDSTSGL